MINLNIPTKDEVRENLEDTVQKHESELVVAGTIAGTAVGLGLMYLVYSKAIEIGVSKGIKRGFGR